MLGGKRVDLPTAVVTLTKPLSAAWDQPTLPCPVPRTIPVPIYPQHQQIR